MLVWRNTIQLFHEYKKPGPGFIGPFKAAGFNYAVEQKMIAEPNNDPKPDVVASSPDGWCVVEITSDDASKGPDLDSYKKIDSRYLSNCGGGLRVHVGVSPDTICSRLSAVSDGAHCTLVVKDSLDVHNEGTIQNPVLREKLLAARGSDLTKLPSISITLLPEMKKHTREMREGLKLGVMEIFAPGSAGKTLKQLVEEGLDCLRDKLPTGEVKSLMDSAKDHLGFLIKNVLSGYLVLEDGVYKAGPKWKDRSDMREMVGIRINEWVAAKQGSLNQFPRK